MYKQSTTTSFRALLREENGNFMKAINGPIQFSLDSTITKVLAYHAALIWLKRLNLDDVEVELNLQILIQVLRIRAFP